MLVKLLLWLVFFSGIVSAQEWQQHHLASFVPETDGRILLDAPTQFGLAYQNRGNPSFPSQFWMWGNFWLLGSFATVETYYIFGYHSNNNLQFWAGGYSLAKKQICFGKLKFSADGSHIKLIEIAKKKVDILNLHNKYVFKFIFLGAEKQLKLEVNGVPMLVNAPFSSKRITHFGYLIKGGKIRFENIQLEGN